MCLTLFSLIFFRKRGGLKIPKIRRASGPMSLFDSQEERHDPGTEEAAAVERPLLYVCGTDSLYFPFHIPDEDVYVPRIQQTLLRFRGFRPN